MLSWCWIRWKWQWPWPWYWKIITMIMTTTSSSTKCLCDPIKEYTEKVHTKFWKIYENSSLNDAEDERSKASVAKLIIFSENIDPIVYNRKAFFELLKDSKNNLEQIWRTRILIEYTPIGNIAMFYDIYKQGFSYYCDQTTVPYKVLNTVAMKYVLRFRCLDFFMDVPEEKKSPLYKVFFEEEEKEKKPEDIGTKTNKIDLKDAPFAKFKNYIIRIEGNKPNPSSPKYFKTRIPWFWKLWYRIQYFFIRPIYHFFLGNTSDTEKKDSIVSKSLSINKITNKFIYLGRFRNFQVLQKPIIPKPKISTSYDSMFTNLGTTISQFSYKDYKAKVLGGSSVEDNVAS